jgi:hypothetical protein
MSGQVNSLFFLLLLLLSHGLSSTWCGRKTTCTIRAHGSYTKPNDATFAPTIFSITWISKRFFYHLPSVLKHRLTWASQLVSIGSKKCISIFRA